MVSGMGFHLARTRGGCGISRSVTVRVGICSNNTFLKGLPEEVLWLELILARGIDVGRRQTDRHCLKLCALDKQLEYTHTNTHTHTHTHRKNAG